MPDSGRRFLAPTTQGTGDGLTVGNAAAASTRLTVEAVLRAAAVADPTVKASGTPADVATEICWRADLGEYTGLAFSPDSTHGGISATRRLRHISVDASGNAITHSVTRDHATLTTTATGENNVARFVGTRTADPRASNEKDRIINIGAVTRFARTVDFAFDDVSIAAGVALLPNGTTHNYGTGAWTTGSNFESPAGTYDHVIWDGFKWKQFQYCFLFSNTLADHTDIQWTDNFFENIKSFIRSTADAIATDNYLVDGLYGRSWSQALFRVDYGTGHTFRNLDLDSQLIVGEPIASLTQFATGTAGDAGYCTIEQFLVKNCWDAGDSAGDYIQGDGVVGNASCHNIIVKNGVFDTMGDGGIDNKSYSDDPNGYALYVENVDVYRAYRSFRIHGGDSIDEGGGLFNRFYWKNCRSFYPNDAHLQVTNTSPGYIEWENPGGGVAMTDLLAFGTQPYGVRIDTSLATTHVVITLRGLTYARNAGTPAINVHDNTSLYPTEALAEAAGTARKVVQQVTAPGWTGDVLVNGVAYDNVSTLPVTEGETTTFDVTGSAELIAASAVPSNIGDVTIIDSNTFRIRWRNTDGTAP